MTPQGGARPKTGPKPRPDALRYNACFSVSKEERDKIIAAAARAGLSVSKFCHKLVFKALKDCRGARGPHEGYR